MRFTRTAVLLFIIIAGSWAIPAHAGNPAFDLDNSGKHRPFVDYWMGLYMGPVKVGYSRTTIRRDEFEGREVYRMDAGVVVRTRYQGVTAIAHVVASAVISTKFDPIMETGKVALSFTTDSKLPVKVSVEGKEVAGDQSQGGFAMSMEARYRNGVVECSLVRPDGSKTERAAPIPQGIDLKPYYMYTTGATKLRLGTKLYLHRVDLNSIFQGRTVPDTDEYVVPISISVIGHEEFQVGGKTYDALQVRSIRPSRQVTELHTEDGQPLREEISDIDSSLIPWPGVSMMGPMVAIVETREQALEYEQRPAANLFAIVADNQIPNSANVFELRVRLVGVLDEKRALSEGRQTATFSKKDRSADYHIVADHFDPLRSLTLPIRDKGLSEFLAETPGIEALDPTIRRLAHQIVGEEKSAFKACCRIREWVNTNMTYNLYAKTPDSALEILKVKTGVCHDFAILYTALARAAGIPTRVATGLWYGYWDGVGNFQYHAWAESYVGDWVPFDAVLSTDFVDATHIALSVGGIETIRNYIESLDRPRAEIIEYRRPSNDIEYRHDPDDSVYRMMKKWDGGYSCYPPDYKLPVIDLTDGKTDDCLRYQTPGHRTVLLPAGSKPHKLDQPLKYAPSCSPDCMLFLLPNGDVAILPPGSKPMEAGK